MGFVSVIHMNLRQLRAFFFLLDQSAMKFILNINIVYQSYLIILRENTGMEAFSKCSKQVL